MGVFFRKFILYFILLFFALLWLIPFFFLVMGSFKSTSELFQVPFRWLPKHFDFDNYINMFQQIPFLRYLKNTLITSEGGSFANEGSLFPAYGVSKTTANKIIQTLRVTVGESINVYAVHPGRMNTDMGRTTAQIEPEEAAIGFCNILEGTTHIEKDQWFIDYRGNAMPL